MDAAHRGLTAFSEHDQDAVQASGDIEADDHASVHRAAAAGVSGAGSALPYFDRIQAAFGGTHDLSQVRAHVGGEAAAASEHMGAEAYATGDHVAFHGQPDLHTAAHEAAHVVQQRAGVQLTGGVGQAGDAYEQHADAVADAVTRGESAAALLGGGTGAPGRGHASAGAPSAQALQMESAEDAATHVAGARGADAAADASATERARTIHEAFHGSLFSEDEARALAQLRGQSVATIRRIRSAYQAAYGSKLEDEFASYCEGDQATEALTLIWPAMPVIDRLTRNTGNLGDNEEGMMDVLRTAPRSELAVAAVDPRLTGLLDELSDDQQYEARRLIWPERKRENVVWRIEQAHGTINDDEDAVYSALLDLTPTERRALWDGRAQQLSFLSESELALVRRMCVGEDGGAATDAAALDVRMEIATEGLGTDDEAVSLVVGRVASVAEEETRLRATLDAGVTPEGEALSAEQRAAFATRLSETGGVHETLLTGQRDDRGALAEGSFLGRLHDDVGTDEYGAFTGAMGGDAYERAKQQLQDAIGTLNDDEQAINRAFRDLRAPLTLPPGRTTADYAPDELRQMQEQATNALRQRLRNDPDLTAVWSALDEDERTVLAHHVAGDTYRLAIHELEEAYGGIDSDEARIVRIVAGMSAEDRTRMVNERPPIYMDMMDDGLDAEERALVGEVFRTGRAPADQGISVAMGGFGDGTDEEMLLDSLGTISDEERRGYRLGYWLHRQGRTASDVEGETERAALQRFIGLYVRMESELDAEELDAAMERLIGLPAPEDFLSPEGRRMAAEIMAHRHRERMALSGGLTEPFTSSDETAEQSAMIYEAHLQQLVARGGEISLEDFSVLVGLDAQFGGRFDEYRATVELVSNIAGTVAATVAAIAIVVLSEGTLAPAAAKLISSSGGAALWAAVAGAGARVGASEAFGGDSHQTMSTEGAHNALVGAIEGAVAVASAALAARAVKFVGLSQRALSAEITRAAVDSTEMGLALSGRGLARGSLEGAIDGFVSGAVGDLVMTATDADTWRRSVWNTLGSLGLSLLRGGAFGAGGGAAVGGAMYGAGAFVRMRGLRRAAHGPADEFEAAAARQGNAEDVPPEVVNEITAHLPEAGIDPKDPAPGIRAYLQRELNVEASALTVEPLGGGFSGAQVFKVLHDGQVLGVFKIFRTRNEMLREVTALRHLAELELPTLRPVGMVALGNQGKAGVGIMRGAPGFVADSLKRAGALQGAARQEAVAALHDEVKRVARAMAELHDTTASGAMVTREVKQSETKWLFDKWDAINQKFDFSGDLENSINERLETVAKRFVDADVPATIVHGDGHGGNFGAAPDGTVDTIDAETLWRSIDAEGVATAPQATDVGRFSQWLINKGAEKGLSGAETRELQETFLEAYRSVSRTASASGDSFDVAVRFYEVNLALIALRTEVTEAPCKVLPDVLTRAATAPAETRVTIMTWAEIIKNVVVGTGIEVDINRLIAVIERASADIDEPEDLLGIYDSVTRRVSFLDALERELRAHHGTWEPTFLARARAVFRTLPRLINRIRTLGKGALRTRVIHDLLSWMEEEAQIIETFQPGRPQCPRCGSQRLDTRKTTFSGTNQYERLCLACGDMQEWEDGISLGEAMSRMNKMRDID